MKAVMDSKLVSCKHNIIIFNLNHHFFSKFPLHHSLSLSCKKKNLAISTRPPLLPLSLSSSSQTQAEVQKHELQIQESSNGYIIEPEREVDTEAETVHVVFQLHRECSFGQNFLIVGDHSMFGLWDPNNAVPLTWSEGHVWTVDLDIPTRKCIKFKFIMQESNGKFIWQPGPDRILECWETDKIITLCEDWESPDLRTISEADPTFNQDEESAETIEIKTVEADQVMPVEPSVSTNDVLKLTTSSSTIAPTEEPKGYDINMKEVLASDEALPVLVPGLSHLPMADTHQQGLVTEALKDEPEPMNGAAMVSAGAEIANVPEFNQSQLNSNPRPIMIPSIHENQDSCENQTQELAEEQDHEATLQPMESLLLNDIQHGKNILKKLLGIFGIE